MKLHLGCGGDIRPDYVNVDLYSSHAEIKDDIVELEQLKDGVYEEILTNHTLEHLSFEDAERALRRWYELLKPGGILNLETPDFKQSCLEFSTREFETLSHNYSTLDRLKQSGDWGIYTTWGRMRNIFGAQDTPGQFHKSGWWKERLEEELYIVGFHSVEILRSCESDISGFSYHATEEPVILVRAVK